MKSFFLFFIIVPLFLPLFFYKLGQTSLISWDEAWYATVARNIVKSEDYINLTWNGHPYFDHPPAGYWLMALTYKIFGINEFWTRFPSALAGIISIALLYLLGKKLFNPLVGLSSAISLTSATWFIFRSRTGNLDIILTMFFLLSILLGLMASEKKKYLLFLAISLALLLLTKTMVPLAIIPTLIIIFYKKNTFLWKDLMIPILIFSITGLGWFIIQIIQNPGYIQHYFSIGLKEVNLQSTYLANFKLTKDYLYYGIGRWFWPSILSLILSTIFRQKRFFILMVFFISFILPTIFSPKVQIWYLIPLFPILFLSYFGLTYIILEKYFHKLRYYLYAIVLLFSSLIYFSQVKMIWYQFIDIPAFVSDEAILSKEAGKYPQQLLVDGDFAPAALFYSEKDRVDKAPIKQEEFIALLNSKDEFLLITNNWRVENFNLLEKNYQILKKDRDKILILHTIN
ncbi:glycosyltransferase family 39 protein [Candidatus Daviesbacteria bacterium]|nr:glycosyltransferase family 39 protein [Candidatus Daviesbacteria bacterium]